MEKYIINKLVFDQYSYIITLLDYETRITECLQSIKISSGSNKKVLIDTALCSGLNQYRFIAASLFENGTININDLKYTEVNSIILKIANEIIRQVPKSLDNSILTLNQKDYFINYNKPEVVYK